MRTLPHWIAPPRFHSRRRASQQVRLPQNPLLHPLRAVTFGLLLTAVLLVPTTRAQPAPSEPASTVPALAPLVDAPASAMRTVVERFTEDRDALIRRYDAPHAPQRWNRLRTFYEDWLAQLNTIDFDGLGLEGRIDYVLLENTLLSELHKLGRQERRHTEMAAFTPFAATVTTLFYDWRDDPAIDPRAAADTLAALARTVTQTQERVAAEMDTQPPNRVVVYRAAQATDDLREALSEWHAFYDDYDPLFSWWAAKPYHRADSLLNDYASFLRHDVIGIEEGEDAPLIGDPIGADALAADLRFEMIPYSPEELIALAEQELAWGTEQMIAAAREMGYGDDWRAALEAVKQRHVAPGEQPPLILELANEAVNFLRERDLVTIPPMAEEVWRMTMLSPEWQRIAPFFLGGEVVRIAFPTRGMSHDNKLMSIRGNNRHFSRAVVHHELIPGHHLQGFMTDRYNPHRELFSTPFWGEGWALYWEMLLWDLDFAQTPEDRIGMLFWRNHRAARIIFSLRFHLGEMTPQEAVDLLVERVGHERANAEAEVRRSIIGSYPPLYQAAYMVGGLQFKALHDALVENGPMSNRAFHDAILKGGRIPVEMVRARLLDEAPARDHEPSWRFYGDPLGNE